MGVKFYTVDVGHGLCQVIRFGDRAILIDGGGKVGKLVAEDFLTRYIKTIVAYVATHNDADHVAAAPELLEHYDSPDTLNSIWILVDRPAKQPGHREGDVITLLGYSKARETEGSIGKRHVLYVDDRSETPTLVHREAAASAELQLLFPQFFDSTDSFVRGTPDAAATNQSSAILRLVLDSCQHPAAVLITGDANCESFRIVAEKYRFDLRARVLAIPHHGGEIPKSSNAPDWQTIVEWIKPEIAVVSAGYGTVPTTTVTKRKTFEPLRQIGITTCCTQITKHCHPNFESLGPAVIPIISDPTPQMCGDPRYPDAIGCAGTITIQIDDNGSVNQFRQDVHQRAVDKLVKPAPGCPHCRG